MSRLVRAISLNVSLLEPWSLFSKEKKARACNDLICTQRRSEGEAIPASVLSKTGKWFCRVCFAL